MRAKTNKKNRKKAICLISGGLDSAVVAGIVNRRKYELFFLFFNYGQKNYKHELKAVEYLSSFYRCKKLLIIKLPFLKMFGGSALFDPKKTLNEKNFLKEYVPFRNSQFLSIATAWGEVLGVDSIFIGSTGGDHICPDNSKKFLLAFQKLAREGTLINKKIKIEAPLKNVNKTGVLKIGIRLKVPYEITWSCHNNFKEMCGHCSNCLARVRAYKENNVKNKIQVIG